MSIRQQVLVLYLANSALDSPVKAWARYDGTGNKRHQAGYDEQPPYLTGLDALKDGWRMIHASPLINHNTGDEFRTGYFKYEFFFEKLEEISSGSSKTQAE